MGSHLSYVLETTKVCMCTSAVWCWLSYTWTLTLWCAALAHQGAYNHQFNCLWKFERAHHRVRVNVNINLNVKKKNNMNVPPEVNMNRNSRWGPPAKKTVDVLLCMEAEKCTFLWPLLLLFGLSVADCPDSLQLVGDCQWPVFDSLGGCQQQVGGCRGPVSDSRRMFWKRWVKPVWQVRQNQTTFFRIHCLVIIAVR